MAMKKAYCPVANLEYDAQGNLTKVTQAPGVSGFGFATVNTYDTLERLKDSTDARSGITRLGYNGRTELTQVTDPRNLVTQYPRNGLGDATQLISPDTGTARRCVIGATSSMKRATCAPSRSNARLSIAVSPRLLCTGTLMPERSPKARPASASPFAVR